MENAQLSPVPKSDVPIASKQDIPSTHALGLQDLYKAAFSQEPTSNFNHFNHKTTAAAIDAATANLIQDSAEKFFVDPPAPAPAPGPPEPKLDQDLDKPQVVYKNTGFDESYQLYTLKGLQYAVDFVKPEDAALDLNYDPGKEGAEVLSAAVENAVVLNRPFEAAFQTDSNSVLDLDKGIQIQLVKAEEMGMGPEQSECNFEACEYTGDAQILHRYLCDSALIKADGAEVGATVGGVEVGGTVGGVEVGATELSLMSKQNNNVVGDKGDDSESVGVSPEVLGVRFEDCDFNSSDSFASTESIIPKNIKCPKCPKKFMFKSDLLRHDKYKHSVKLKLFCKYCNKEFVSQQNLFFHEKSHKTKQNSYQCDTCKKAFKKPAGLVRHVINKHSKSVPFSCVKCDKFFATQSLLKGHFRKVHRTEPDKPFKCDFCPKSFDKRQGLSCHAKAHLEDHPFLCQHCSKAFSRALYLKNHLKSHAVEEKESFVCDTCGKDFKSAHALEEHGRKHTGEKPFTCNICMKGFAYKAYLRAHIKKHSAGKPHPCALCDKSFVTATDLNKHSQTFHPRKSTLRCNHCNLTFSHPNQLAAHLDKHTNSTPTTKSHEVCTQTVDYVDDALHSDALHHTDALHNVTLQNVNVIVDQSFDIQQPIVLASIGSFIDSNSVPVILTQNPSGP